MKQLTHRFLEYHTIFTPVLFIILGGVFGGTILASALLLLLLMFSKKYILGILFALNIFTFFLADNFSGSFSFAQNFRFVLIVFSLLYLLKYKLFQNNNANYLVLFTIIAFGVTLLFSPLGVMAMLRSVAFWLVALVIFKLVNLLYVTNAKKASELIVLVFTLYVGVNLLLIFLPFLNVYQLGRFKGLAGNPNGLGLIMMFIYVFLEIIKTRKETTFKDNFFLFFKFLLFFIIILTGSRTAFISVSIFEIISKFLKNKKLFFILLLSLLYIGLSLINIEEIIATFGLSDYLRIESVANASGRTDVWPIAVEEIKKYPWFGNGLLYDDYFIKKYVEQYIGEQTARHWGGVWSSYLSLLLDVGIIGFIAYIYFWVKVFSKAHYKNLAVAFVVMCMLSGITESWMAASMNASTPMMFLFWAIQLQPITTNV